MAGDVNVKLSLDRSDLARIERQVKSIGKEPIKLSVAGGTTQKAGMLAGTLGRIKTGARGAASSIGMMATGLGKWGLGIGAGVMAAGALKRSIGEMIDLSREQQRAENDLENALKQAGYTQSWYAQQVKDTASAIQEVTTIGDEQTLQLATLATNMGITFGKLEEATKGAIGLAQRFESAGLSQETAMKGIALAYQGNFTQLERYIPALRNASSETEKMAILQDMMAKGFAQAEAQVDIAAGKQQQLANTTGDVKEKFGELFDNMQIAFLPLLKNLVGWLDSAADAFLRMSMNAEEYRQRQRKIQMDKATAESVKGAQEEIRAAMAQYRLGFEELINIGDMSTADVKALLEEKGAKNMSLKLAEEVRNYLLKYSREGLSYAYGDLYEAIIEPFVKSAGGGDGGGGGDALVKTSIAYLEEQLKKLGDELKNSDFLSGKWFDTKEAAERLKADIDLIMSGALEKWGNSIEEFEEYVKERSAEVNISIRPVGKAGKEDDGIEIPPINTDEVDLQLDEFEDRLKQSASVAVDLGRQIGESLARGLTEGKASFRQVLGEILGLMLDFINRAVVGAIVSQAIQKFATGGLAGLVVAGVQAAAVTAMVQTAKTALTGFERGGVLVGEKGPEVIGPARDFSSFAGQIVAAAIEQMRNASLQLSDARQAERGVMVRGAFAAEPVEMRMRGSDMYAIIRLHEKKMARSSLGGM